MTERGKNNCFQQIVLGHLYCPRSKVQRQRVTYTINSNWRIYVRATTIKFLQENKSKSYDLVTGKSFKNMTPKTQNDKSNGYLKSQKLKTVSLC